MPTKTSDVTYNPTPAPGDTPQPITWWFSLWKDGAVVGAEQTFTEKVPQVTFSADAGSGYTIQGGQRDGNGTELGTPTVSDPFDLVADIIIDMVAKITIRVG